MVTLLRFGFKKIASKMLIFQGFLRPKKPLVATFSETCAPSSKTNVAEQGTDVPNWSETLTFFGSHSTVFALVKMALKMLNFPSFYLYKKLSTLSDTRPANIQLNKVWAFGIYQRYLNYFGCRPPFLLSINYLKKFSGFFYL